MATLTLTRHYIQLGEKQKWNILINGATAEKIKINETKSISVNAGNHEVQIKARPFISNILTIKISESQNINISIKENYSQFRGILSALRWGPLFIIKALQFKKDSVVLRITE